MGIRGLARSLAAHSPAAAQVLSPNGTVLHDLAPTDKSHLGFQVKSDAGDYRACFSLTPLPAEPVEAEPVEVTDPLTGLVSYVKGEPAAGQLEARAAAEAQAGAKTRLRVEWLSGVAAKDWDSVAKKDHLSELSAALTELESELQSVYRQMLDMRSRVRPLWDCLCVMADPPA